MASPSGDLVAAFSTFQGDVDIVLFDTQEREPVRNLTRGYTADFRHYVAQMLTLGRKHGSDLAFSPDGNSLAAFVRKEAGYSLAIVNVLGGGVRRVIDMEIEQQTAPAWSPDGRSVAFAGNQNGQYDIFELDLDSLEIRNLTNDEVFDGSPSYSHDGKWLVFSSVPGENGQLFRLNLETMERVRLGSDEHHNTDPVFSSDDRTVYFTSDRTGAENIFGLNMDTGELRQYTNAITGCFQPTVLGRAGSDDRLVYTGFWQGPVRPLRDGYRRTDRRSPGRGPGRDLRADPGDRPLRAGHPGLDRRIEQGGQARLAAVSGGCPDRGRRGRQPDLPGSGLPAVLRFPGRPAAVHDVRLDPRVSPSST